MMNEISRKLQLLIQEKHISYRELSEKTGIAKSAIQRYVVGETGKIPIDRIKLLADALDVSAAYLMGWEEESTVSPVSEFTSKYTNIQPIKKRRIPMLGTIAAGKPIFAEQDYETYVDVGGSVKADFALTVEGDSMDPLYKNGDIVFIRSQPDVRDGQVAAVIVDDSATLKRVYHLPIGVQLVPVNPEYEPMLFTADNSDNIVILGLAVGYFHKTV